MLNTQGCISKGRDINLFPTRRLGTEAVNSLVTISVVLWPGHTKSSPRPCRELVYLEPASSVTLWDPSLWKKSLYVTTVPIQPCLKLCCAHGTEFPITRKLFPNCAVLNMTKINCSGSDSRSLKHHLLSRVVLN